MNQKIDNTLDFIDLDLKFLFSILKKYLIHLIFFVSLITVLVFLFSLNLDKKYRSYAKIVIEPDKKNIVNIQEYSNINQSSIKNNQIAIFKSDQVLKYITQDKENSKKFEMFFAENNQNFVQKLLKKKKHLISNLTRAFFQVVLKSQIYKTVIF